MFEDEDNIETADNEEISEEETPSTSPVEQVDQTKAFAKRLKEEKAKAKQEALEELAQSYGYNSWQEYADAQTNSKLLDKGFDPDEVREVLKDLMKTDPEYVEAMKYKAEKEELEKELFATNSIQALNAEYGTNFKSIKELDEDTIRDWNNGMPLNKAYAANNYSKLIEMAVKKASVVKDNGKSHLKTPEGSNSSSDIKEYSKSELDVFKAFGISEQQAKDYKDSHNNK